MLKHLSLFAGCGGIDLGFQWAGIKTVAGVEIKQFACDTLKKNHPGIKVFGPPEYEGDVRQFNAEMLREMVGDTEISKERFRSTTTGSSATPKMKTETLS